MLKTNQTNKTKHNSDKLLCDIYFRTYTSCLFLLPGACWDTQAGVISEALVRELTPAMPVLYVRAAPAEEQELKNTYACPVYRTKRRGPTYVWTLHLQTRQPAARWTLAGVALLLSV